ncbi:MAG TPA: hypothetical protein VH370_27275 [Humisphaera sp.]|jgi:Ca2+-binding RTX toxin-like protein|nr:hypothetical protein [Humisphaera sp.]
MHIENLENRRLLSATLSSAGVLIVNGTAAADEINITRDLTHHQLVVKQELRGGGAESTRRFDLTKVKSIVVNAGAGNDEVVLGSQLPIAALINGGDGNDELIGGAGNDSINGGNGNDEIFGGAGNDLLNGNVGNDHITGGAGSDQLNGGDGDDQLFAVDNSAHDTLNGGNNTAAGDQAFIDRGDIVTNVEHIHIGLTAAGQDDHHGGNDDGAGHH